MCYILVFVSLGFNQLSCFLHVFLMPFHELTFQLKYLFDATRIKMQSNPHTRSEQAVQIEHIINFLQRFADDLKVVVLV